MTHHGTAGVSTTRATGATPTRVDDFAHSLLRELRESRSSSGLSTAWLLTLCVCVIFKSVEEEEKAEEEEEEKPSFAIGLANGSAIAQL